MSDPLAPPAPQTPPTSPAPPTLLAPAETGPIVRKSSLNKKAVILIAALFIIGTIVGLILSNMFVTETNNFIEQSNNDPFNPFIQQPLSADQIILPTFGVVIVCVGILLLIGTIAVYIKIGLKTKSRYIVGLLIFLTPILVETVFALQTLRNLFSSAAIQYAPFRNNFGFGFGGIGGVLVITSVFEIIGLTMLLYLSTE